MLLNSSSLLYLSQSVSKSNKRKFERKSNNFNLPWKSVQENVLTFIRWYKEKLLFQIYATKRIKNQYFPNIYALILYPNFILLWLQVNSLYNLPWEFPGFLKIKTMTLHATLIPGELRIRSRYLQFSKSKENAGLWGHNTTCSEVRLF